MNHLRRHPQPSPSGHAQRFVVKFNNGSWKVFDTLRWTDEAAPTLEKEARDIAEKANAWNAKKH